MTGQTITPWQAPTPKPDEDGAVVATWQRSSVRVYVRENGAVNIRDGGTWSWTQRRFSPNEATALAAFLAAELPAP